MKKAEKLIRASVKDAKRLWEMQVEAFTEMYKTYQDTETSPAAEPMGRTVEKRRKMENEKFFSMICA